MSALAARLVASLALALAVAAGPARAAPEIQWRIENPFRFFLDAKDTELHRATFASLEGEARMRPVLEAERALAERHPEGWAAALAGRVCYNLDSHRHSCPDGRRYINPDSHRVVVAATGIEDAETIECSWSTAPSQGRGRVMRAPCNEPIALDVSYPAALGLKLEVGGVRVAETTIAVTDLLIVGIGDSFAAGEGNPDIPVRFSRERAADYGTVDKTPHLTGLPVRVGPWKQIGDKAFIDENARWLDQACHRSLYSHQLRAALQLAVEDPHRAVTYVGVACSGGEITAGLFLVYKGNEWVPSPPDRSQISAVAEAQCGARMAALVDLPEAYHMGGKIPELKGGLTLRKCDAAHARKIDLVLMSIGGNDVGFARLVANAVLADKSLLRRLGGWFGQVHGFVEAAIQLDALDDRYKALNRALHSILHVPWAESDRILLVAYPPIAVLEDGKSVCPDGQAGMTVLPDFNLSAEKAQESGVVAERLHDIMALSARQHGWTFVDRHRANFRGRGICAGFSDQALSSADDLRLPRKVGDAWEPFNPADWKPYVPRQRWFRTPNDAFMTGNFHVSASLLQKVVKLQTLSWFQVLLASTYSGAFHPTAEGQAAIADAVVERSRQVLARYARPRPHAR